MHGDRLSFWEVTCCVRWFWGTDGCKKKKKKEEAETVMTLARVFGQKPNGVLRGTKQ